MMEDQLDDVCDETVLVVDLPRARKINMQLKELRFFSITLRLFGFWHPPQGCCWLEKAIYPVVVNLSLLAILALDIINLDGIVTYWKDKSILILQIFGELFTFKVLLRLWLWVSHLLTIRYFKKRSLEQHIVDFELDENSFKLWKKITLKFNILLSVSILLTTTFILICVIKYALMGVTLSWREYLLNMSTSGHMLFGSPLCPWDVPINLSLTWVMFLLSKSSEVRLEQMQREFANWNEGVEDAIHHHCLHYSEKIRLSSKALSGIFVTHNVFMIVATPFLFHLIVEMMNLPKYSALSDNFMHEAVMFFAYLFEMLVCWIAPLYFAEQLAANETKFKETINDFCPGNMQPPVIAEGDTPTTFCSRQKVQLLLSYLKGKRMGFVVGGYSFQLKLSYLSFYLSLIVLAIKLLT